MPKNTITSLRYVVLAALVWALVVYSIKEMMAPSNSLWVDVLVIVVLLVAIGFTASRIVNQIVQAFSQPTGPDQNSDPTKGEQS